MKPKIELIKDAYAIVDGVPDKNLNLRYFLTKGNLRRRYEVPKYYLKPLMADCGTIACAAGLIAMHPGMVARGLKLLHNERPGGFAPAFGSLRGYDALSEFFGLSYHEVSYLFGSRGESSYDDQLFTPTMTDKQLWLARVRTFLARRSTTGSLPESCR